MTAASEGGDALLEFATLAISPLAIAVITFGAFRLCRRDLTKQIMWLRVITPIWLLSAVAGRAATTRTVVGFALGDTAYEPATLHAKVELYYSISWWLLLIEQLLFVAFAFVLVAILRTAHGSRSGA